MLLMSEKTDKRIIYMPKKLILSKCKMHLNEIFNKIGKVSMKHAGTLNCGNIELKHHSTKMLLTSDKLAQTQER